MTRACCLPSLPATANEIYTDIQILFNQLVLQSGGLIDMESKLVLALAPSSEVALTTTNQYNVNVYDLIKKNLPNLRIENALGMFLSQFVTWCIIVATATILHAHGVTNIATAADAAKALVPLVTSFPHAGVIAGDAVQEPNPSRVPVPPMMVAVITLPLSAARPASAERPSPSRTSK